jgi:hypothetical protein
MRNISNDYQPLMESPDLKPVIPPAVSGYVAGKDPSQLNPAGSAASAALVETGRMVPAVVRREEVPKWSYHHDRKRQARALMSRRISRNDQHTCHRLNGSYIVSFRMPEKVTLFTGSSLNRKKNEKPKPAGAEKGEGTLFAEMDAQSIVEQLCGIEAGSSGGARDMAGSKELPAHPLRMLSARTKSKISAKCAAFFRAYGKKATFATLSFIQSVADGLAVKILNKFLTVLRRECGRLNYLWVAERQTKNKKFPGNIHFHLLFNRRMDIQRCNDLWVMQQYNDGLVGWSEVKQVHVRKWEIEYLFRRTAELKRSLAVALALNDWRECKRLRREIKKHRIQNIFNPFDIKKIYTVDGLSGYLTKYITKNDGQFACAAWHCSRTFSRAYTSVSTSAEAVEDAHNDAVNFSVNEETGEVFFPRPLQNERRFKHPRSHFSLRFIMNKQHFTRYLVQMDAVNRWIFEEDFIPDTVTMTPEEYVNNVFNHVLGAESHMPDILKMTPDDFVKKEYAREGKRKPYSLN